MKGNQMNRDVNLKVDGLKIAGQIYLPEDREPPYPAVILCHGVPSGAAADPNDGGYPLLARTIAGEGFAVLIFSFRGAGDSEGNFDIVGWTHDLAAAIDYLWGLSEIDESHLSLVGFSAGGAVSIYVAAQDKRVSAVAGCAAPADFSAISDPRHSQLTLEHFRKIGIIRDPDYPASREAWLNDFRKISALRSVADIAPRPLLLVHADQDNVVPFVSAQKLFAEAGEPKKLVTIRGPEHRLRRSEKAVKTVLKWLKENSTQEAYPVQNISPPFPRT
jgi:uncharacterized protein